MKPMSHYFERVIEHRYLSRPGLALCGLFLIGLLQAAFAEDKSIYTTVDETIETSGTDDAGNPFTRSTTTTTETRRESDAANRESAWKNDPNALKFPYDS